MTLPSAAFLSLPVQPRYTRDELQSKDVTVAHLQTIFNEWGIPIPSGRGRRKSRKASYISIILNHDNNVDPAFTINFGMNTIPLPPYTKGTLKRLPIAKLNTIRDAWVIPQNDSTNTRRGLITAILNHVYANINYRDALTAHDLDDAPDPGYDTDTEPALDNDQSRVLPLPATVQHIRIF